MESDHCRQGKWSSLWWCCSCGLVSKELDRGPVIEGMGLNEGGRWRRLSGEKGMREMEWEDA